MAEQQRTALDADRRLLRLLRTRGHQPHAERLIALYSRPGEHAACWLALGTAGSLCSHAPAPAALGGAAPLVVAVSYAANSALKLVAARTS